MMTAKNIHASKVTPILANEVSLNTGMIRKMDVSSAAATAYSTVTGQLMFSPPYILSVQRLNMFFFMSPPKVVFFIAAASQP